jgi:hypothetical protein
MKKLIFFLLFAVSANAQTLWEVNVKSFENEIGQTDTVKYISGRVAYGYISSTANSGIELNINFHKPNGSVFRSRVFTQGSYTQNLTDAGMPLQQAQGQAEYVWTTTIPALLGTNYTTKRTAIVALLSLYGYTLKE